MIIAKYYLNTVYISYSQISKSAVHCALFKRQINKLVTIKKVLQALHFCMNSGKLCNGFNLVATFENICTIKNMFKIKMGLTG